MSFHYPWLLSGMLLIPLCAWFFFRRRRASVVVSTVIPAKKIVSKRRLTWFEKCFLAALVLLIFALAAPRRAAGEELIKSKGVDIILAVDLSGSMQAIDRPEKMDDEHFITALNSGKMPNRLDAAKAEIRRFIEARPNDRIGLIGFADFAYSFVPPTLDHALLLNRLDSLQIGEIGEQTGIASPIGAAVGKLKSSSAPRRVLVLFTDGANTARNQLTPQQAAELAAEFKIIIHTVGIGSENACAIVRTPLGPRLAPVRGSYDAELLHELAGKTGGAAFHAADADGMNRVMKEINAMEKTNIAQPRPARYQELAPWFALGALALLMLGLAGEYSWKMRLP